MKGALAFKRLQQDKIDKVVKKQHVSTFDPSLLPTPKAIPANQNLNMSDEELKEEELKSDHHSDSLMESLFDENEDGAVGHGTHENSKLLNKSTTSKNNHHQHMLESIMDGENFVPMFNKTNQRFQSKRISSNQETWNKLKEQYNRIVKRKTPLLLSVNSPRKIKWDLVVMMLATFNCFQIPLDVAFEPPEFKTTTFIIVNACIDLMFLLDILVSFRTTIIDDKDGQEVDDPKKLSLAYLKGQFTIDLLATLPFDLIAEWALGSAGFFKALGALKLVRVLRLNKIITYLRSTEEFKAFLKLVKLIFYLVMYLHCFGCIWWVLVSQTQLWIPPLSYNDEDFFYVYNQHYLYQYFVSLHAAVLLATGNDIGPRDTLQVFFGGVGLFLGAIINANIFGELAVLVSQLNAKSAEFQSKMTQVNTAISNLKLPQPLTERTREFILTNQASLESQNELERFLRLLSPSIKARVINHDFKDIVQGQDVFNINPRLMNMVLQNLQIHLFKPEAKIIEQGKYSREIYFLCRGYVEVSKTFDQQNWLFVTTLAAGSMFGESSAVLGCRSNFQAQCKNYCTVASLTDIEYQNLSGLFPEMPPLMMTLIEEQSIDPITQFFKARVDRIHYFKNLKGPLVTELSYHLKLRYLMFDQVLINPGEKMDKIVIVMKGCLEVFVKDRDAELFLDYLGPGSVVGQYSVLGNQTILFGLRAKMMKGTTVLQLDRKTFDHLRLRKNELDVVLLFAEDHVERYGVPQIDYLIYNDKQTDLDTARLSGSHWFSKKMAESQKTTFNKSTPNLNQRDQEIEAEAKKHAARRKIILERFQRSIRRLTILSTAMLARGNGDFQLGSMIYELSSTEKRQERELTWIEMVLSRINMDEMIGNEVLEKVANRIKNVRYTTQIQSRVFKSIKDNLSRINFNELLKEKDLLNKVHDCLKLNDREMAIAKDDINAAKRHRVQLQRQVEQAKKLKETEKLASEQTKIFQLKRKEIQKRRLQKMQSVELNSSKSLFGTNLDGNTPKNKNKKRLSRMGSDFEELLGARASANSGMIAIMEENDDPEEEKNSKVIEEQPEKDESEVRNDAQT